MKYCQKCGITVKNMTKHITRQRCKAQHYRLKIAPHAPSGITSTGGFSKNRTKCPKCGNTLKYHTYCRNCKQEF